MRRSLGFKLQEAGKGCSISSRSWSSTAPPTSPRRWRLPGRNNRRTFNRRIGRND